MDRSRFMARWTLVALLLGAPVWADPVRERQTPCAEAAASLSGAWEKAGGGTQILFKEDQIVFLKNGNLSVAKVLKREPCTLGVRYQGLRATWTIGVEQGTVTLKADEVYPLERLGKTPQELHIDRVVLPAPMPVSPEEVDAVKKELASRWERDQTSYKDPALKGKRAEIMADNLRYLRELTQRVGWIDIPRFGKGAAAAAILIAKHGSDLLLMKAALPVVERDVKESGGAGEMFSVLFDELQITLGNQQRYGTQLSPDGKGSYFILPLENAAKVNEFRKEIGILSFEEYQKLVAEAYGLPTVRVAGSEE